MQTSTILDYITHESDLALGNVVSDDEYPELGSCSVFSESESDFDQDNCMGNCDTWEADWEAIDKPSSFGKPEEDQQPKISCLKRGSRDGGGKGRRVSFIPERTEDGSGVFKSTSLFLREASEWDEPSPDGMPKGLLGRRVSEGLTTEDAVRRLDVPFASNMLRPEPKTDEK